MTGVRIPYRGLAVVGGAIVGAAAANSIISRRAGTLENVIGGHERTYRWRLGDIFYTIAGEGEPVLFIHGVSAGVSSYEWRKNFLPLSDQFTVYALDLLGFGLSDKPDVLYNAHLYSQLIIDFIMDVIGRPVDIAASSHGAAYVTLAAEKHKPLVRRLLFSCPTGIGFADKQIPMSTWLSLALKVPVFGQSVYYGLTSYAGIEGYLKSQVYANPVNVGQDVIDHYYAASHLPGADRAIRAFIAGKLNVDVSQHFSLLTQPVAIVWGKQARITPVEMADRFIEANSMSRVEILNDAAQLPHEERCEEYNDLARDVFASPPEGVTVPPHKHIL